jgi:hypothetical protein
VPFIFLSKREEVWSRDKTHDAHLGRVEAVFTPDDLLRPNEASDIRRNPFDIAIDMRFVGGGRRVHQTACIVMADLRFEESELAALYGRGASGHRRGAPNFMAV